MVKFLKLLFVSILASALLIVGVGPGRAAEKMPSLAPYVVAKTITDLCTGYTLTVKAYWYPGLEQSASYDAVALFVDNHVLPAVVATWEWGEDREDNQSLPLDSSKVYLSYKSDGHADKVMGFLEFYNSFNSFCGVIDSFPK